MGRSLVQSLVWSLSFPRSLDHNIQTDANFDWNADSGTTSHMTPYAHRICNYTSFRTPIRLANNLIVYSAGIGSVRFTPTIRGQTMRVVEFTRVLHVPDLRTVIVLFPISLPFDHYFFYWCAVRIIVCYCLLIPVHNPESEYSTPQLLTLDSSCLISCYSCTQPCSSVLQRYINVPRNRLWAPASRRVTNIIFNYNVQFNSNLR